MGAVVSTSVIGDRTVYHLGDDASGATASVLPSYGFNLFDLNLPIAGTVRPVVAAEPGWAANPSRPARNGFPVLFPFPGRIRDARYSFRGQAYELVPNKPPHAIHGFAHEAAWDVLEHEAGPDGATILGRFQISRQAPEALSRWPADAVLWLRYTLRLASLTLEATVENPSDRPLPWGFGLHSYFILPFDRREDRSTSRVLIPAEDYWVLQDSLPTGVIRPVAGSPMDFRSGRSVEGLDADLALTGLEYDSAGSVSCLLVDDALDSFLKLTGDHHFREIVVFTPPANPGVIAVEPYTAMADAFHLADLGIDPGLAILPPGGTSRFRLGLESLA